MERYPELPRLMYDLLLDIKNEGVAAQLETIKNNSSDPWGWESVERSSGLMGGDIWPYGASANWAQIVKFMGYLREDAC